MQTVATELPMGFCEFQAVKFSQSREIHRCTRKRQGCTRNRLIDPFDFAPAVHFAQRIDITNT